MAEINIVNSKVFNGKHSKIFIIVLLIAGLGFLGYAKVNGVNMHVKSGQINGTNLKVTEYLDGQVEIEGKVTDVRGGLAGSQFIVIDNVIIDTTAIYSSSNLNKPIEHYIQGDIKRGTKIKGLVLKDRDPEVVPGYTSDPIRYEIIPMESLYIMAIE